MIINKTINAMIVQFSQTFRDTVHILVFSKRKKRIIIMLRTPIKALHLYTFIRVKIMFL